MTLLRVVKRWVGAAPSGGGGWQLASGHYVPAKMALQIIAPRASLTTANRYYKQYPGIAYRVPVCVLGGAWPFKYELTSAPSGMAVGSVYGDADYGIITWPNPTTSGSPYTIDVKVTDQDGSIATVSYTLTVTTSGFIFIDPVNGNNSNAGTLASPKQSMSGLSSSAGDFIYLRSGTTAYGSISANVIIGYPGETCTLDCTGGGRFIDGTNHALCGLSIIPKDTSSGGQCISYWDSGATNILIFENTIAEPTGTEVSGSNSCLWMSTNNNPNYTQYVAFVGNTFQGSGFADFFLAYYTKYVLIENNSISNNSYNSFYAKLENKYWSIRRNVGMTGNSRELFEVSDYAAADSFELCWNKYNSSGDCTAYWMGNGAGATNIWYSRNTWIGNRHYSHISPINPLVITNDVFQFSDSSASSHGWVLEDGATLTATYSGEECVGRGATFLDSSGNLTGSYLTYKGTRGCEVA